MSTLHILERNNVKVGFEVRGSKVEIWAVKGDDEKPVTSGLIDALNKQVRKSRALKMRDGHLGTTRARARLIYTFLKRKWKFE